MSAYHQHILNIKYHEDEIRDIETELMASIHDTSMSGRLFSLFKDDLRIHQIELAKEVETYATLLICDINES